MYQLIKSALVDSLHYLKPKITVVKSYKIKIEIRLKLNLLLVCLSQLKIQYCKVIIFQLLLLGGNKKDLKIVPLEIMTYSWYRFLKSILVPNFNLIAIHHLNLEEADLSTVFPNLPIIIHKGKCTQISDMDIIWENKKLLPFHRRMAKVLNFYIIPAC